MKVKTLFYKERDARCAINFAKAILSANNIKNEKFEFDIYKDEFSESLFVVEYKDVK